MARIRSLKPEFWDDRKLARSTSRDARMLYMGLWNQADEHSRLNGDPVWIKGRVFAFDDDLEAQQIKQLLDELDSAGRIQRYDVDGDPYIYLPKLGKHQRLEAGKVESRLPEPPAQIGPDSRADLSESRADKSAPRADHMDTSRDVVQDVPTDPDSDSSAPRADSSALLYVSGSMDQVAGSRVGAQTDAPTAHTIIAEWMERTPKRPPGQVVGQVSKLTNQMLAEGIDPDDIRRGLATWMTKGLHPSTLPSVVNEVMNAPTRSPNGKATTKAQGWLDVGKDTQPSIEGRTA